MSQPTPGYLTTLCEAGTYVGGIMITDQHGIPKDFKYTDPVSPTKVQRIIYGSVLEKYIRNHVIVGVLVKEIAAQPAFFVVQQHQLAEIEEANQLPLIALQRTQFASLGDRGAVSRSKENECLVQGYSAPHPLRVIFGSITPTSQDTMIKDLVALTRHMDPVEPLERLEKALKSICLDKNLD